MQIPSLADRLSFQAPESGVSDVTSALARLAGVAGVAPPARAGGTAPAPAVAPSWIGALAGVGTSWLVNASASKGTSAGYAKAGGDFAFLSDPSVSIEDKLARFMMTVQKNLDDELTRKMSDYQAKYGEGGTETKKKEEGGGGFLGGLLNFLLPGIGGGAGGGIFDSLFGGLEKMLGDALKSFGGPLLSALATAVGLPMLAPAAGKLGQSLGSALAGVLQGGNGGASGTKSSGTKSSGSKTSTTSSTSSKSSGSTKTSSSSKSSSSTAKGEAGSPDERLEMLEIQRMVEKQNQLFTLVSNLMKGMHETTMVAVQNVR